MTFARENLSQLTNSTKNGIVPAYFIYHNENSDTVTDSGYFVDYRLAVGDIIQVQDADYATLRFYVISAVSAGKATAVLADIGVDDISVDDLTVKTLTATTSITGDLTGNADTASVAPAGALTGTELKSTVITSSLTSVGTITTGVWNAGAVTSSAGISATTGTFSGEVTGAGFYGKSSDGSDNAITGYGTGCSQTRGSLAFSFGNEYSTDARKGAWEFYAGKGDNSANFGTTTFFNANGTELLRLGSVSSKTDTSATFAGDVSVGGALIETPDNITSTNEGVAASLLTVNTNITTNGDSDADNVTLANGTVGQRKVFAIKAVGNVADSIKITPNSLVGGSQITFAASPLGLGCIMEYTSAGWVIVGNNGGTVT